MKDKLIELLKEASEHHISICSQHGLCTGCPNKEIANCRLGNIADFLLANGVTIQRWIPVEERLPTEEENEDGIIGIVYGRNNNITFKGAYLFVEYDFEEKKWRCEGYDIYNCKVTHWIHFAEAPKEEA